MIKRTTLFLIVFILLPFSMFSQQQKDRDSLIRLLSAYKAQLIDIEGKPHRKIEGNAKFFHNNTNLNCDIAIWNVNDGYIDATGSVQIIQDHTVLTGDNIHYIVAENTAQFRGTLVQLIDRDGNTLRTHCLDYNTKDSVATFWGGASMKDKDGNIIESEYGTYESKLNLFTFIKEVEMFSDSLFYSSDTLKYQSKEEVAYFGKNTKGWNKDNYISADGGWYNKKNETVFFEKRVYIQTSDYEVWCEKLFYNRNDSYSKLYDNIQILDTVNNTIVLGDVLEYWDKPRRAEVTQKPAIILIQKEDNSIDSVFMAADSLIYFSKRMDEVDSLDIVRAKERLALSKIDAYKNALDNMKENAKNNKGGSSLGNLGMPRGNTPQGPKPPTSNMGDKSVGNISKPPIDTLSKPPIDTLSKPPIDTLTKPAIDTSQVIFINAHHNVRVFKNDMQMRCDSLVYTGIDSIARLYIQPILWKDTKNQLTADSMQVVVENQKLKRGFLLSNAMIITQEQKDMYYNQVKSPEMVGYFDNGQLSRFDALGGTSAIFYLEEDSVITTMNYKETKILSARLKDGALQKIHYLENIKSDAHPVFGLAKDKQRLKDFKWSGEKRPGSRFDITDRVVLPSIRKEVVEAPTFPNFSFSSTYFSGYIDKILKEINGRTPLKWKMKSDEVKKFFQ